jgi:hypothetical protein
LIPEEYVTARIYMFKAERSDVRIKYGDTVVALVRRDDPNCELIVCKVKNEPSIARLVPVLEAYFDEKMVNGQGKAAREDVCSPWDYAERQWKRLVTGSQSKRPFLDDSVTTRGRLLVKDMEARIDIRGRGPLWTTVFLIAFGLFMVLLPLVARINGEEFHIGMSLSCFALSLVGFVPASIILASARAVRLHRWNRRICLRFGCHPFAKELSLPCDRFEVHLYRCGIEQANKVKKPGQVILSLIRRRPAASELVLSTAENESQVASAFEALASFIGASDRQELTGSIEGADGGSIEFAKTSLSGHNVEGKKRKFKMS